MRRFVFIIAFFVVFGVPSKAEFVRINVDRETVAAMTAAYGAETFSEKYYSEQLGDILDRYSSAEVAAAAIFATKCLDRKALTNIGIWGDGTENYYYRRIYSLVATKIMPKILTVAKQMLNSPQTALYWGSYLMKVCDETKNLCYQFESVVTNSTLTFSDIAFLCINPEVAQLLNVTKLGSVDWDRMLDDLAEVSSHFTKENLVADLDKLYSMAADLVARAGENASAALYNESEFNTAIGGKLTAILDLLERYEAIYDSLSQSVGGTLMSIVGGPQNVHRLFDLSNYELTSWITDYLANDPNSYNTQRFYIYRETPEGELEVYEDLFDSYTMDSQSFTTQMSIKLAEYNDNEDGTEYKLGRDVRRYYTAISEARIKGCESVIISAACHDTAELGSGSTQFKCRQCSGTLNSHSRECAMKTTVADDNLDTSELDGHERAAQEKIAELQGRIDALEQENSDLIRQISQSDVETAAQLRQQYNANKDEIASLKQELAQWQQNLADIQAAKEELANDNATVTDDHYRIPAIMAELQSGYGLTWTDNGSWSGYTFTRHATAANLRGTITFTATLSITRKPKKVLGILIHRCITQISWKLSGAYSDTQIVDIIELDPDADDASKTSMVNGRISQAAQDYPGCDITSEYIRSAPTEGDSGDDAYHLLWASDRLDVARQTEARLTQIYADLVSLEKMMNYKLGIVDVLKKIAPYVNADQGRRQTLIQERYNRWRQSIKEVR